MMRALFIVVALTSAGCSSTPHRDEIDPRPPPAKMPARVTAHCGDGQDAFAAFCRVNARLMWARSRHDSVLVACIDGPHRRLQAIRDSMPADAGADEETGRLGDVMTQREILRLEREAEECGGS